MNADAPLPEAVGEVAPVDLGYGEGEGDSEDHSFAVVAAHAAGIRDVAGKVCDRPLTRIDLLGWADFIEFVGAVGVVRTEIATPKSCAEICWGLWMIYR